MALRFSILLIMTLLVACSREYAPDNNASGEDIYKAACLQCHKPAHNGSIFMLKAEKANKAYIGAKVQYGSLLMPSFPNITGKSLDKLSNFALEQSDLIRE